MPATVSRNASIAARRGEVKTVIASLTVALMLIGLTVPAHAQAERRYSQLQHSEGQVILARSLKSMSAQQLMSIGLWAAIGTTLAQNVVPGSLGTIIGLVGGALIGNWWYEEGLPPF